MDAISGFLLKKKVKNLHSFVSTRFWLHWQSGGRHTWQAGQIHLWWGEEKGGRHHPDFRKNFWGFHFRQIKSWCPSCRTKEGARGSIRKVATGDGSKEGGTGASPAWRAAQSRFFVCPACCCCRRNRGGYWVHRKTQEIFRWGPSKWNEKGGCCDCDLLHRNSSTTDKVIFLFFDLSAMRSFFETPENSS